MKNFFKKHTAPTLHNAVGGIIAGLVAFAGGALLVFAKDFRNIDVPAWTLIVMVSLFIALLILYIFKKPNPKPLTLDGYSPKGDASRLLATLWHFQQREFPNGDQLWAFWLPANTSDLP